MKIVADLQIHSKYSRATSAKMELESLSAYAKLKGIQVIGTGDFTHPDWFNELKNKLVPAESGLFVYKNDPDFGSEKATRFMLTAETSHIYSKTGKTRRVHILIWAPSLEAVEKINTRLSWVGNLKSDGRPIIGMDSKELAKIVLESNPDCMVIPAHAWTPWFSVFGSMSGFDSLEQCFEELTPQIYAIETGLSSDSAMNWRLSQLDKVALVSNSDSHSLVRIGREANVFELEGLSYQNIIKAVKNSSPAKLLSGQGDPKAKLAYTIEFYPEEGKYHYDGHRDCGISFAPSQTKEHQGLCPKCGKPLTIGVLSRVEQLADRPEGYQPEKFVPFKNLVPLDELIAESLGLVTKGKQVYALYNQLCQQFGGEVNILTDLEIEEIKSIGQPILAEAIKRVREDKVIKKAGYDGEYGKISVFEESEREDLKTQKSLF
ncbi:MAG: endonuclease Q family protein [Patescibacteria group bacterium]